MQLNIEGVKETQCEYQHMEKISNNVDRILTHVDETLNTTGLELDNKSKLVGTGDPKIDDMVLAIIPFEGTCGSHHHHPRHRHRRGRQPHYKSLHFSLFQHETINKTGYDPLTAKANRSSKQLGTAEGTSITSGLDGLSSILVAKLTLRLKNHKGSISIVGGTNNLKRSDHPVVGGTKDFLFVQGYVTSSAIDVKGPTVVYKIGFHLYWPPYPPRAS
ncbi:Dirigent protein 2 [Spatholobus suberectus]|nr:Dirigent protein 2 [Spatholobus suberectus]